MKIQAKGFFFDMISSPIGNIFLICSGSRLCGISFKKPDFKRGSVPERMKKELKGYFEGKIREFTMDTVFTEGTDFEKKVWSVLKEVPYGETRTYKWVAESTGNPKASRAVGQALGKNPMPVVFPCHRVVEADGSIGGYSAGIDIKRRLLALEYYNAAEKK